MTTSHFDSGSNMPATALPPNSSHIHTVNHNHNNPSPTAPQFSPSFYPDTTTTNPGTNNTTVDVNDYLTQEERDELLARKLQEEEEQQQNSAHYLNAADSSSPIPVPSPQQQQPQSFTPVQATIVQGINNTNTVHNNMTNNNNSMDDEDLTGSKHETDEEIARRLEREMNDEIYARQLQEYERCRRMQVMTSADITTRATASDIARIQQNRQQANQGGCSQRRWCSAAMMLIIVAGAAVLVLFYGSSIWDRLSAAGDQIPPFFWEESDNDPISGEEFKAWRSKGNNGLELTIVNTMSSDWYPYFNEAVADWDKAPALKLSVEIEAVDPDCKYIPGKLKCCNKAYGLSGWSGLNEAWLDDKGIITASTAKMNESYLKGKPYAEKRYVTCHEIGHGFGLPHRDVNVNNPNLGTCLDYTTSYTSNVSPDETDYENLKNLYGEIGGQRRSLRKQPVVNNHLSGNSNSNSDNNKSGDKSNNNNNKPSPQLIPKISKQRSYKDGRLLYKSETKEIYEEILPKGGRIISTLLLANVR